MCAKVLLENVKIRDHSEITGINGRTKIKWTEGK
jgi:hypothetical protein